MKAPFVASKLYQKNLVKILSRLRTGEGFSLQKTVNHKYVCSSAKYEVVSDYSAFTETLQRLND